MAHYLPRNLARYHGVILSFIPHAHHERLLDVVAAACKRHHPSSLPSVHQEITLEIKKLSRPCTRCLDLRSFFDNCEPVLHDRVTHYLDEDAQQTFHHEVSRNNGIFNVVLYHQILDHAKARYAELIKSKPETVRHPETVTYPRLREQPLVNQLFCTTPKLSHNSKLAWSEKPWTDEALSIHRLADSQAELLRCEQGRLRIGFPLGKGPAHDVFYVYIYEHDPHIVDAWKINRALPLIVNKTKVRRMADGDVVDVQLHVDNSPESLWLFRGYLQARLKSNHRLLHEQFDPLLSSVLAKSHTQWWQSHTSQLGVLCAQSKGVWQASYRMHNEHNQALLKFVPDTIKHWQERLIQLPNIQSQLRQAQQHDVEHTLGLFLHQDQLFVETRPEKLHHASWRQAICSGAGRLVKYHITSVDAIKDGRVPSALPDHVGGEFAILNQPLRKKAHTALSSCNRAIYFNDISELLMDLPAINRPRFDLHILGSATALPEVQDILPITAIHVPQSELRQEDRFECALPVSIKSQGRPYLAACGITENVSANGLRVKMSDLPRWEPGESLDVEIQLQFGTQTHTLTNQPYQLIGSGQDNVCRLAFSGAGSPLHIADKVIQQYICRNIEDLHVNSSEQEVATGISVAVRNVLTANQPEVPFFVQKDRNDWSIASADTKNATLNHWKSSLGALEKLSLILNHTTHRPKWLYGLGQQLNTPQQNSLFVVLIPTPNGDNILTLQGLDQLKNNRQFEQQTDELRKNGVLPSVLRIQTSMTNQLIKKDFKDELQRLKRLHAEHGDFAERIMQTMVGSGSVVDVTADAWRWFDTVRGRTPSVSAEHIAA